MKTHGLIYLLIFILLVGCLRHADMTASMGDRVIDSSGLLKSVEKDTLFMLILDLENKTGSQIAIVIIDTLYGKKINVFGIETAEKMHLGREKFNDGLLVIISVKDKEARIEVGNGLEAIIKDEIASHIMIGDMIPNFKENRYFEGLRKGIIHINTLIISKQQLIGKRL